MKKVVSIVGMAGSGKSEVSKIFTDNGFISIRFGDATDIEIKKRGMELNEENERSIRESLRKKHGMAAYAILNQLRIDEALKTSDVVVDGLYSWEEYKYLKDCYGKAFHLIAVHSSPETRYGRLKKRPHRPLTEEEAASRDKAEIENLKKGGPIAMADFIIINEYSFEMMEKDTLRIVAELKKQK